MAFFKSQTYQETYDPHEYHFSGKCINSGKEVKVSILGSDLWHYNHGAKIQDCFPYIDAKRREWMMTGMLELF